MYKITLNTSRHKEKISKNWESILQNDFIKKINGITYILNSKKELIERLEFIAGHRCIKDKIKDKDFIELESLTYNKQFVDIKLNTACGYVDIMKEIEKLETCNKIEIEFLRFYDLRQKPYFKQCFIEIEKI